MCLGIGGATITADGLLSYKPPSLLEELDLTDCWLLTEPALLDFCEAHPRIMVWNEKTVPVTSSSKPRFNKKEYGDVVNGGLATSSTRQLLQAKLDMRKSSSKLSVKGRMQATKKAFNNTIGVGVTTKPLIVIGVYLRAFCIKICTCGRTSFVSTTYGSHLSPSISLKHCNVLFFVFL